MSIPPIRLLAGLLIVVLSLSFRVAVGWLNGEVSSLDFSDDEGV